MSLILDALRKMEQERKTRRGAAKDLRPEVLRYRGTTEAKPDRKPYLMLAAGLILLLAGAGAGFLLKGNHGGKRSEISAEPSQVAATATVATAASPAAPIPRFEPAAPPAPAASDAPAVAVPEAPAPSAPTTPKAPVSAVVPPPAASAEISDEEVAQPAPKSSRSARARKRHDMKSAATGEMPVTATRKSAVTVHAPGDITLSGIAWQDERPMRRAVLNGSLVGEGAMVAGARVVEIKENKVRLARGGQQFEISLSASLSSR